MNKIKSNFIFYSFVLSLYSVLTVNGQTPYCTSFSGPQSSDGNPVLPNRYSARVEMNLVEEQRSIEMDISYNNDLRKAFIEFKQDNLVNRLIFNFDTDEIFSIKYQVTVDIQTVRPPDYKPSFKSNCTTEKLSTSSQSHYFGFSSFNSSAVLPGSPAQVFNFFPQAYNGTEIIRGIPCDVFLSCQYNPHSGKNFTVKHYFSKNIYGLPGTDSVTIRIPIRAVHTGISKDLTDVEYNHVYDYYDFRASDYGLQEYETPGTLFCENRKLTDKQPPSNIPNSISFSEEIFKDNTITDRKSVV